LPAGSKRDKQELSLQLALAPLYRVTKGWAALELERVLDRALALCDTVGDDAQGTQTLYGLQSVYVVQARLERVQMISDELQTLNRGLDAVKLVQDLDQPFNQALVSAYLALLQQLRADEAVAREHAEQAYALASKYQAPYYRAWAGILVSYALAWEQPNEES